MDEELREKLVKIVLELPDENSWLDYKQIPYEENKKTEFIKDLCAFLNCRESYGKDKFIIFGIEDKTKKKIGLVAKPMQDDEWYQTAAEKIEPFPIIETGKFKVRIKEENKEIEFGFVYISKNNTNRVYSIRETIFLNKKGLPKDIMKNSVFASTAFIRRGSKKSLLSESERREIYEADRKIKYEQNFNYLRHASNINDISKNDKILKATIIFGEWDETNEYDKKLISDYIGLPYEEWIEIIRTILKEENSIFTFNNNIWKVKDKIGELKEYSDRYFRDDIIKFQENAIEVLSERNPKFDLPNEKRRMANIYNKNMKYSSVLRESIAQTLPIIKSIYNQFINCIRETSNMPRIVVKNVLNSENWEIWASLEEILPFLAEASPEEFLTQVETKINLPTIKNLFVEGEEGGTFNNYSNGLYRALDLIAWENNNFVQTCMIYSNLAQYDEDAIEKIAYIILPWYPQTYATITKRKNVVNNIIRENIEVGWKLILKLLPGGIDYVIPTSKSTLDCFNIDKEPKVSTNDYMEQIKYYVELALDYSRTDVNKICDLIENLSNFPPEIFDKICNKISDKEILKLKDEKKYVIWNSLEDIILQHIKFKTADWALSKEKIDRLKNLSDMLKPKNIKVYTRRFFRKESWKLIESTNNYKYEEEKLHNNQLEIVRKIYDGNIENIINYAKVVEDSYIVGICLAEILNIEKIEEDEKILNYLQGKSPKLLEFAKGFAYKKFDIYGNIWIEKLNINKWKRKQQLNFLLVLPLEKYIFNLVKNILNKYESQYWQKVQLTLRTDDSNIDYIVKKLLEVNRNEEIINFIGSKLCIKFDIELNAEPIIKALEELIIPNTEITTLLAYNIKRIIKKLQTILNTSNERLFGIEWKYLQILDDDECKPTTIENVIANNPQMYNELLSILYKPHNAKENNCKRDKSVVRNVWKFFEEWKTPPGLENGNIDRNKLYNWYTKMKEICLKSDRLEVGLLNFGRVLFYSPKDKDGFWIDRSVAEILNQEDADIIRRGFSTEIFNSLGVINYDSEGSIFDELANKYEEQAEDTENNGFYRLARTIRDIADSYRKEAEDTRNHYYD